MGVNIAFRSARSVLPVLLAGGATVLTIPLVMGFWGALHPAFDSLAHFRVHLSALIVVLALPVLFFPGWRSIGAAATVLALAAIASAMIPRSEISAQAADDPVSATFQARYRLLQLNLRYDNHTPKQVLSLIGSTQPDVVTLDEVSTMWSSELALIEGAYPHRLICAARTYTGNVAILSRRPFLHPSRAQCFEDSALAVATINFGGTAVDVAAIHLGWPWPFDQSRQVGEIIPILERLGSTAIMAGDLNATPWSVTARRLAEAGRFTSLRHIGPTWLASPLPDFLRRMAGLPIDNIFVKGGVVPLGTKRLANVGSDHLPVLLEFSLRGNAAPAEVLQANVSGCSEIEAGRERPELPLSCDL